MHMPFRLAVALVLSCLTVMTAHAAADGETLYSRHCGACHGEDGAGGIGVPLSLNSFQATIDDEYLRRTIRYGRPGRIMPAFNHFSDQEVAAIVKHIRGWNRGGTISFPRTPIRGDTQHGGQLYAKHCAACHGARGCGRSPWTALPARCC